MRAEFVGGRNTFGVLGPRGCIKIKFHCRVEYFACAWRATMGAGPIYAAVLDDRKKLFNKRREADQARADLYRASLERNSESRRRDQSPKDWSSGRCEGGEDAVGQGPRATLLR